MLGIKILKNVYIIGAGLAGLSASIHGITKKLKINLFESSNLVGGRCRSYYEKKLDQEIDNGNHLVFSANHNFYELCKIIGSDKKIKIFPPSLKFFDPKKMIKWNFDIARFNFFEKLFKRKGLIPGTNILDYFSILKFLYVNQNKSVSDLVGNSKIFQTFWDPLTLGVMNTSSEKASAKILSNVLKQTIFKGHKFCHIYQPEKNWNDTLIQPSINFLKKRGGNIKLKNRLKNIEFIDDFITKLHFDNNVIKILKGDLVIFALPPSNLAKFFPRFKLPTNYNSIVNIHYKLPDKLKKKFTDPIVGFINSYTHWIFIKEGYLSVTVSNANYLNNFASHELAIIIWEEICSYINIQTSITDYQVVKEKKATVVQSPSNFKLVSELNNLPKNMGLSGDWTQTDLPCTIEGSILSGKKAINAAFE